LLKEESLFFVRVKELYNKDAVFCTPFITVRTLVAQMKQYDVSGMVVVDEDVPIGVVTDRDLRDKVIAGDLNPYRTKAESIMSFPVVTIKEDDFLSEAVHKMLKNNIHRLPVVNDLGEFLGVITNGDIIRFQTDTALYFMNDLEAATSVSDVRELNKRMVEHIGSLFKAEVKPRDLVRLISYLNDLVILKVIRLNMEHLFKELPKGFCFLALGSEGRMEQTLKTDQDNAIVYSDALGAGEVKILEEFSVRLIDDLIEIGFPSCPGGIMAKNSDWRRSLSDWISTVKNWVREPTPGNILNYSMFSDLRTVYGDFELERELKDSVVAVIRQHPVFLAHMANNVLRFKPPINFLGGFRVERKGLYAGRLDIKMFGLFPLTEGIKLLALEAGIVDGGTNEKIAKLVEKGIVPEDQLSDVEASFNFFVSVRLRSQLRQVAAGQEPTNYIDPYQLDEVERERLKVAFSMVKSFQSFLSSKYNTNYLAG
jgi:CBS domain-containing protein